jgi:hypothetical protein
MADPEAPRRLRADAAGNRAAIVAMARDAFRRHGPADLPEPPTTAEMTGAMLRLAADRGCGGRRVAPGTRPV